MSDEKKNWKHSTALKLGPHKPILFEQRIVEVDGHPNLETHIRMESARGGGHSETFNFKLSNKLDNDYIGQLDRNHKASVDELRALATDIAIYIKLKTKQSHEDLEREIFWKILHDIAKQNHDTLEDYDTQSLRVENIGKSKAEIMKVIDEAWIDVVAGSQKTKKPLSDVVYDDVVQNTVLQTLPELEDNAKKLQSYAVDFGKGDYQYPDEDRKPINEEAIEAAVELRRQIDNMRFAIADAWWHAVESISDVRKIKFDHTRREIKSGSGQDKHNENIKGISLREYYLGAEEKGINKSFLIRAHQRASAAHKKAIEALADYQNKLSGNDSPENKQIQDTVAQLLNDVSKALDIVSEPRGLLQEIESSRVSQGRGKGK